MWFVYVVRCSDRSLYTGVTTDAERRVAQHNDGTGARYTRSRGPVELVYLEKAGKRGEALMREHEIKRMSTAGKNALVAKAKLLKTGRPACRRAIRRATLSRRP
jgi:putative endonuclease